MSVFFNRFLLPLFIFFSLLTNIQAQDNDEKYVILLRQGKVNMEENLEQYLRKAAPDSKEIIENRYYRIIQFYEIPTEEEKENLQSQGISLLEYIPNYAFIASVPTNYNTRGFNDFNVRGLLELHPDYKIEPRLLAKDFPSWAMAGKGQIRLNLVYFSDLQISQVKAGLQKIADLSVIEEYPYSQQITVQIPLSKINQLAALAFLSYIEAIDPPPVPENLVGVTSHRSNQIASDHFMGRHYDGNGVLVAMGDDGIIGPHIDYEGRVDQSRVSDDRGDHGDHVAGTIMGAGNLNPIARGMAFGAELHVYDVWAAIHDAPNSYNSPGIRITSLSYGNGCNAGYTNFTRTADQQIRQMPSLMHVFSAGNSGSEDCDYGAGAGWGNVTGGIKAGKNVITVGNVTSTDILANSSSRGPVHDGRIKPDVCAVGTNVFSTVDGNQYDNKTGTSMSCPGVTGTIAQLYHAHKELKGTEPHSGLIKAVLMNSCEDLGNPGPDFKFGYGRINAYRSVKTLEDNNYISGLISQGNSINQNITVPAGTKQVKVMLYWADREASANAAKALVNDLDMQVTAPNSTIYLPWVLNHAPNSTTLDLPATRGIDHVNNVEQVTIDDPLPGIYQVNIQGYQVPFGPQTYFLVYEFISDEIEVTYPFGGESFVPGVSEFIRWDAHGNTGPFSISYSLNNGVTWINISTTVPAFSRFHIWTPPIGSTSGNGLIKVERGLKSAISEQPFSIIGVPQNIKVDWACPDSVKLSWSPVTGANAYEASRLGSKYMDSAAYSNTNSVVIHGIHPLQSDWFSVKANGLNNASGRRAIAIEKALGTYNCPIADDVSVQEIISPFGSLMTCTDNTSSKITLLVKNEGITAVNNIPVNFQIDNGPVISEVITNTLNPGESTTYTFNMTVDLTTSGGFNLKAWPSLANDKNPYNDTVASSVRFVIGIQRILPWFEDFEKFSLCTTMEGCESINCQTGNGWLKEPNNLYDDIDWRTNRGATPSGGTGPSMDYAPGTENGRYIYLQSRDCFNKTGIIISPCIEIDAGPHELSFWYHMYGAPTLGELHVDIFADGAWKLDAMPPLIGNKGNSWFEQNIDLSAYSGKNIIFRFRGITGMNNRSDIAIDNVKIQSTLSVNKFSMAGNVNVYPNPSMGVFTLNINGYDREAVKMNVTSLDGRSILSKNLNPSNSDFSTQIDLSSYAKGIYILHLASGEMQYQLKLFVL
ncbi:MAG: S8 family serine peptidase [Bacteroidetes bacterium]|nr:S8 family serine peptidase [Bacteroidota bacterium]